MVVSGRRRQTSVRTRTRGGRSSECTRRTLSDFKSTCDLYFKNRRKTGKRKGVQWKEAKGRRKTEGGREWRTKRKEKAEKEGTTTKGADILARNSRHFFLIAILMVHANALETVSDKSNSLAVAMKRNKIKM